MQFVKGLLGAAAILEIVSENPAACKCCTRPSKLADGTTCRP